MPRKALWTSIRETLAHEIAAGQYLAGDKLPTEAELSRRFDVNRHTIRRALSDLAETGQVYARRGAGVFVTQSSTDYPIGRRVRFNQSITALGRTPGRKVLLHETRAADQKEAEALDLPLGAPVHANEGLSLVDGEPIAMSRSVFPAERFPGFLEKLRELVSVTATFKTYGVEDYTRSFTRMNAKLATPTLALHLRIAQGAPILRTISVNADMDGRPIEFGRTWFAGDRVTLTMTEEGSRPAPETDI
ncbi:MAG: phosphonate metabolism transcriptional regulator PhnF [Pseudomonadota bacterium]